MNMSLDHSISQITANMEKTTNGHAMESSHEQLTNIRRSPTEDSLFVNVGSSGSSDVTLPYSPRADPVEERRASGVSGSPPPTGIESGPERVS